MQNKQIISYSKPTYNIHHILLVYLFKERLLLICIVNATLLNFNALHLCVKIFTTRSFLLSQNNYSLELKFYILQILQNNVLNMRNFLPERKRYPVNSILFT